MFSGWPSENTSQICRLLCTLWRSNSYMQMRPTSKALFEPSDEGMAFHFASMNPANFLTKDQLMSGGMQSEGNCN